MPSLWFFYFWLYNNVLKVYLPVHLKFRINYVPILGLECPDIGNFRHNLSGNTNSVLK